MAADLVTVRIEERHALRCEGKLYAAGATLRVSPEVSDGLTHPDPKVAEEDAHLDPRVADEPPEPPGMRVARRVRKRHCPVAPGRARRGQAKTSTGACWEHPYVQWAPKPAPGHDPTGGPPTFCRWTSATAYCPSTWSL